MITIDMIDEFTKEPEKLNRRRKDETLVEGKNGPIQNGGRPDKKGKNKMENQPSSRGLVMTSQGPSIRLR